MKLERRRKITTDGRALVLIIFYFAHKTMETVEDRLLSRKHCHDLWINYNVRASGRYEIDPDGDGEGVANFTVYCDMGDGSDPRKIITVVHHDSEVTTHVKGAEAPGSYVRNITYVDATEAQVVALIDASTHCEQYIKWHCKGAVFGFWYPPETDTWWVGRNWTPQYYWGGAATDSRTCECHPYCLETKFNSTCNCDANEKLEWYTDDGLLLDRSRLPVLQIRIGDTGQSHEAGQYTIGPLKCRTIEFADIYLQNLTAPVKLANPGFPRYYPRPFNRYHWNVLIPEEVFAEIIFTTYEVLHWGAYLSVKGCENVMRLEIRSGNSTPIVIEKQRYSPPYFVSDGTRTEVRITLVTCHQMDTVTERGFAAEFRRTECYGCAAGLGKAGSITNCSGQCGIIASYRYPYPHHDYSPPMLHYNHTWIITATRHKRIHLIFNDFDIPGTPGERTCTVERGMLSVYSRSRSGNEKFIGNFCNLNKQGHIYSRTQILKLVYTAKLDKVGNGRGFHATYKAIPKKNFPPIEGQIKNVAVGKPALQSSILENQGPNLAVDGSTNGVMAAGSCISTHFEKEPWWRVDLQKRYEIHRVKIYNRDLKSPSAGSTLLWPKGSYALPMPKIGCPNTVVLRWEQGKRHHDLECPIAKDESIQHWSDGIQLKGGVQELQGIDQYFCVKSNDSPTAPTHWMAGQYCIFRSGDSCPEGFRSGYIRWIERLQNNKNSAEGTLPDGKYGNYTLIHFCCRGDGEVDQPIRLPTNTPFYLLQYGADCQRVEGMTHRHHFFHFCENRIVDLNNSTYFMKPHPVVNNSTFEKGFVMFYCYYDISTSLRGFKVLVDNHGMITTWTRFWDNKHYGIAHVAREKFGDAYTCIHHPITEKEVPLVDKNCTQPVVGQFVTLYVYDRYDSLQVCEVEIYGREVCGQPLGMAAEEIFDWQISATSTDDPQLYHWTNGRLNHRFGWCANPDDELKYLQVDLGNSTIAGVVTQGLSQASHLMYTNRFKLAFSNDNITWWHEEEPVGKIKSYSYKRSQAEEFTNDAKITYNMLKPIMARFIRFIIEDYVEHPCVRIEILGCRGKAHCDQDSASPSGTIESPNYPYYYGQDKSCWWKISPPVGKHVHMKFFIVELADPEPSMIAGDCRDLLTVFPGFANVTIQSNETKTFPRSIVSNGTLRINLKSCFRSTITRRRGFYANYSFVDCHGCGMGDYGCAEVHTCSLRCGHIMSAGYPMSYANHHRCRWHIKVAPNHYINLTTEDFDIVGGANCEDDYVDMYDGDVVIKASLIGRFCNERIPLRNVISSWNNLIIEFSSGAGITGRGFHFRYTAEQYRLPETLQNIRFDAPELCPSPWKHYNNYCYRLFEASVALQWYAAESECHEKGGHLVSVQNQQEMTVLHYLLTNVWQIPRQPIPQVYIGLTDENREGRFRWTDGNPMSYADWAEARRYEEQVHQPDGGQYEDCTMIRLENIHSTKSWHDIPCSLDNINGINTYICKMSSPAIVSTNTTSPPWKVTTEDDYENLPLISPVTNFLCNNREVVGIVVVCDGRFDCSDGSDEFACGPPCPSSSFTCDNGRCVSISKYCDFENDCGDGSDENMCEHPFCDDVHNFPCKNGQCIPRVKRCDLIVDCKIGTDEMGCSGKCQSNSTFQCYDGTCIPSSTFCDGYFDCPGFHHEDERKTCFQNKDTETHPSSKMCKEFRKSCQELYYLDKVPLQRTYEIDPDEDGPLMPFTVECRLGEDGKTVWTYVHHDTESRMYVREMVEGPGSYQRQLVYEDASWQQLTALIEISSSCRQHVQWHCRGVGFHFDQEIPSSWWVDRDGNPQYYWGDAKKTRTCECYPKCANNLSCNCDADNTMEERDDVGYLTKKNHLPIRMILFGNTHKTGRFGFHTIGPLECTGGVIDENSSQCSSHHEWIWCQNGVRTNTKWLCLYEFDHNGFLLGCRDATHLRYCVNFTCPNLYLKCPGSYCIPQRYRCNGLWDCPGGYDELNCESYSCFGQYHCVNQSYCLPLSQLCDGIQHCTLGDDEMLCDVVCPLSCTCQGLFTSCIHQNLSSMPNVSQDIRKLDLSYNKFTSIDSDIRVLYYLGELSLAHNAITELPSESFQGLKNLYKLDLSFNEITTIKSGAFLDLQNLKTLLLDGNRNLHQMEPDSFQGLSTLPHLLIVWTKITKLENGVFAGLRVLHTLNLSRNMIEMVEDGAFSGLNNMHVLDLQGNTIREFSKGIFNGLESMKSLITDSFKFCCLAQPYVEFENCLPRADEFSSCKDLMSNLMLRMFLWTLGIIALIGNLVVIAWRSRARDTNKVSSTLILSLGCADFLMGVYLLIVASVDTHYRGDYIAYSDNWRESALCKVAGFLSTLSSEVSVFTLTFITLERLICIVFPLSTRRFTPKFTRILIVVSWLVAAVLAGLPLVMHTYFQDQFYARSGVCLALHITNQKPAGWEYSVIVFFGINLLAFLVIFAAYAYMYSSIRRATRNMSHNFAHKASEVKAGRQMALIVLTNFCCWMPIILMGLCAMAGLTIPGEMYAWTAVFILPLNSAINPIIYTLSSVQFKAMILSKYNSSKLKRTISTSQMQTCTTVKSRNGRYVRSYRPPKGYCSLVDFLRRASPLLLTDVLAITQGLCESLAELHEIGLTLGGFEMDYIFVFKTEEGSISVYLPDINAYQAFSSAGCVHSEDTAKDMEDFGKIVKKMLQIYHVTCRQGETADNAT